MPKVTLDVVPLPPPRIKPHERTRLPFRFSPVFDFNLYQNLLRTLTEGQVKASLADTDLKLLLSTVKEGRVRHSHKPTPDRAALMLVRSAKVRMQNFQTHSTNHSKDF
jgi:hypothetical protein